MDNINTFSAPPRTTPVLRVEGLIKIYGKRRVVDGVSFYVNRGEIVGLLGPNGAGKTTSFRMACGLIDTNGGIVYLDGKDVTNWPMYRRSREGGMGYLPQAESVFRNLSVQDNLLGVMEMLGMRRRVRKARCDELLEKFKLTHLRRNRASGLSGGERRRLEIARALVSDPKIILLDEPFAAIDPITVHSIQEIIRQLSQEGISILVTDHKERETLQITQRSYVIRSGQVLCHGTPEEVLNNEEARKVYFGNDVAVGNSTVHLPPAQHALPPQAAPPNAPGLQPGVKSGLQSGLQPRPGFIRPRPKPVETLRTDRPEAVPAPPRKVEPMPARPIATMPPRPTVRPSVHSREEQPVREQPLAPSTAASTTTSTTPSASPSTLPSTSGTFLETVNTFLWGTKKR